MQRAQEITYVLANTITNSGSTVVQLSHKATGLISCENKTLINDGIVPK